MRGSTLTTTVLIFIAAAMTSQVARAKSAQVFKVWQAACDHGVCAAETKSLSGQTLLRISRSASSAAPWHVSLHGLEGQLDRDTQISFWLNGTPAARLESPAALRLIAGNHFVADENALAALFPGLRAGRRLAVTYTRARGARQSLSFSLNGLSSALAWISAQQRRSGSKEAVGAPGARGRKLAQESTVQARQKKIADAKSALPEAIAKTHGRDAECDLREQQPDLFAKSMVRGKLDADKVLFMLPCFVGAYNMIFRIYVYDARYPNDVRPEYFASYSDQRGWFGKANLINADYDPESKTITARELGRGLGDCGSLLRYRWTADGLRLITYRYWAKCDGTHMPKDWPVIYEYEKDGRPGAGRRSRR